MSTINNAVKNDDLDELTAMLQSLDEPVAKAAKSSGSDDIDDLLAGLDDHITRPVEAVADEVINSVANDDMSSVFEELEGEHESVKVVETAHDLASEPATENEPVIEAHNNEFKGTDPTPAPEVQTTKTERAPAKPRFTLEGKDEEFFGSAGLDREAFTSAFEKAPVKAKDKILNLLNWFSGGPEISVYTVIAVRHILETKTATSNSIKLALMSNPEKPYPLNTASTQAGQMMALFPAVGIAKRDGGTLTLNEASPIIKKFVTEYTIG
ncbi:hypothetical protein ACRXLK_004316 [Cronobacter turicensis]|uniref:hypothetical protein n=1 Tax=Cronobacter TaxID=413496 RepID=UPI0018F87F1B|nr:MULTISPECIES: hypothetical protein [Cronobacter]ELQ6222649.1 hypothetical protein [Cronobacter turicensis]MDT3541950.1 hypothetical protein [Cronobacter sakazakii]MDT3603582.1 hypothetical protein [Cronobacter malonaticus]MDT3628362.1 hypothetical protein [Cronobacter sakazakii]MDT3644828.1 hypothetical protein [Cronobacter malonaticus]